MADVRWDLPCKSCFAKGTYAGFTLTVDGVCEDCFQEQGCQDFHKTIRNARDRLKKNVLDAQSQETFFCAYSRAKTAGISEAVMKNLYMQHQRKTRGLANPQEKIKAKRSKESSEKDSDERFKQGDLADNSVKISVGLGGAQFEANIEPSMSIETIRARIHEAYPLSRTIKLSAGEVEIESIEALMQSHREGKSISATFVKDIENMDIEEVREELAIQNNEFLGHLHTLSRLPQGSTTGHVAQYLWNNQLLLTPEQAQRAFDSLLPKIRRSSRPAVGRSGPRAQLILALHSFCLDPYAIWEPNDDCDECLWAKMRFGGRHLGESSRHVTRGKAYHFPSTSSSSSSSSSSKEDVRSLRSVLQAARCKHAKPLETMACLEAYNYSWLTLALT